MASSPDRELTDYIAASTYDQLPASAVENAKTSILDTLGVALAARRTTTGEIITDYVRSIGAGGPATVIGWGLRTAPELAALANGVLAHALDYDERGHAGPHLLGPVLALAEHLRSDGRAVVASYVAGREVRTHLNEEFDRGRQTGQGAGARGWHSTGVLGPVSAAAASARMLDLDAAGTSRALGIAASTASGLNNNWGTMTKPLHAGHAARSGVMAAQLAAAGFSSSSEVFTGRAGFVQAFTPPGEFDFPAAVRGLRQEMHLETRMPRIKPYPCCTGTHAQIEAMRLLRTEHDLRPERVEAIECTATPSVDRPRPATELQCRFSVQFCLVATLVDGEVNLENTTEAFLQRQDVQRLLARTRCTARQTDVTKSQRGNHVLVRTEDGAQYEQALPAIRDLKTPEEIRKKFLRCAHGVLDEEQALRILVAVQDLEHLQDIEDLTTPLRVRPPTRV